MLESICERRIRCSQLHDRSKLKGSMNLTGALLHGRFAQETAPLVHPLCRLRVVQAHITNRRVWKQHCIEGNEGTAS